MSTELSNGGEKTKRKRGNDWVRKRVSLACDPCRKKKLKCDGARPFCSTCLSLGRKCLFEDAVKKRGLPEGYVRGLETLLGLLQSADSSVESTSKLFEAALGNETAKMKLVETWNESGTITSETYAEKWRGGKLCKALESLLPTLDAGDLRGQDCKKPRMEPHAIGDEGRASSSQTVKLQLPPREEAEELLTSYFTYTNSWLPIISKDELLASYYQTLELSESSIGAGENTVLWAVLACGQHQKEAVVGRSGTTAFWRQSSRARSLYDRVTSLILSGGFDLHIGHVQALLVLSLIKVGLGQPREAWLVVNDAINIAIDLGANDTSSPVFKAAPDRCKRVFFGCFYLDTILAACLNRPSRFRKENATRMGSIAENGLDEWGYLDFGSLSAGAHPICTRSISIFNHLLRMIYVLSDFCHEGFSADKNKRQTQNVFDDWKASLPPYCSFDASINRRYSNEILPPHILNLRITYLICSILYQRRCGISTTGTLTETQALCRAMEVIRNQSTARLLPFPPPTFCLMINLTLGNSCLHGKQWAVSHNSVVESSSSMTAASHIVEHLPACTKQLSLPVDHDTSQDLGANQLRFASDVNNRESLDNCISSLAAVSTIISKSQNQAQDDPLGKVHGPAVDGYLVSDPTTEDLASHLREQDVHASTSLRGPGFPDLELVPTTTRIALDPILQDMDFADDYFFELSNLDQVIGNQDETYRNLGFLLDVNEPDPAVNSSTWQLSENDQVGTHTPDEWSQWFGQPDGI